MYVLKAAEFVQEITDTVSNTVTVTVTLTACILFNTSPHIASTAGVGQNLDSL